MLRTVLTGLLALGLCLIPVGCDSGGDNGGGDDPDPTPPAAPSNLDATAQVGAVELSWEGVEDAEGYNVYRSTSSGEATSNDPLNTTSNPGYTDDTAEEGTTYYYQVTAVGEGGESDPSNEAQARLEEAGSTAPATPAGLNDEPGDGEVFLSWESVSKADSYSVYRSTASGVDPSGDPLVDGLSEPGYTDTAVENGTTYYYRVTAVGSEGTESDASGEVEGTPFAPPMSLEGTSGDSQIELDWSAAAGAASYRVYRDTSSTSGTEGDPLAEGISRAAYTDTSAQNGTKYYYRVTSINPEEAESEASNQIDKTPFSEPPDRP